MRSFVPIGVAGYLTAILFSLAPAAASAEKSNFQCSLTASDPRGGEVAIADTLDQLVVVKLVNWRGEGADFRISRSMLYPVFLPGKDTLALSVKTKEPFLRFSGSRITAQNDTIVSYFKNNNTLQTAQEKPVLQRPAPVFSGFKALVGRHTDHDENDQEIEVDVYVRIIVDWSNQTRRTSAVSLHRAAIVISQVPVGSLDRPVREKYYRFLPNRRPFRMLVCALNNGQAI